MLTTSKFLNHKTMRHSSKSSKIGNNNQTHLLLEKENKITNDENENEEIEDINKNIFPTIHFLEYTAEHLNITVTDSVKYLNNKEFVLPNTEIIKENFNYNFISPKFEQICLDSISLDELIKLFPYKKINIVLDIDQTLIYSKDLPRFNDSTKHLITDDSHQIQVNVLNRNYDLVFNLREYLKEFLFRLKKISKFYICTLSHENYARKIIQILKNHTNIEIPEENVVAVGAATNNAAFTKSLSLFKNLSNPKNTIIVDDSAIVWKNDDLQNLLLSKKFYAFNDLEFYAFQYIGDNNKRLDRDCYFEDDENKIPIYVENETSKNLQLKYLINFIENAFKLSLIRNEEIFFSMQKLKKRVLYKTKINFSYFIYAKDIEFLKEIVKYLGGDVTSDKTATTHFIVSIENVKLFIKPQNNNYSDNGINTYYCVNLRWLFHCYFFLNKMDENLEEYKVVV